MQGNVISFQIDHRKLIPGVYLHEVKEINGHFITTFDIRFKCPNHGDYLLPIQAHTIEHVLATFFTGYFVDKLYFGPMGCLTGFYLVLDGKHTVEELVESLDKADEYWEALFAANYVPAKTPLRCGNYKMLSIRAGYTAWKSFYYLKPKWGTDYPVIPEGTPDDTCKYTDDISVMFK